MTHLGEERTNEIRYRFNPLMRINFPGTKISSDTDILLVREIYEGLDDRFCDFTFRVRAE